MLLKKIDFLSPQITLYHKGFLSHSSMTSGTISIISLVIIIIFGVYYSMDLIKRENPKIFFFNRFVEDAGLITLNSSSLFHYISLYNNEIVMDFDFYSLRLIGFEKYYPLYFEDRNISKFNHWIYGPCDYDNDGIGLKKILNKEEFIKSACIKKFYSSLDNIYYDIGNPKFKYPSINHGNAHSESNGYSVILEKCEEETLELILGKGNKCKDYSNMEYLFKGDWGTNFNFIDHYVDVLDYKEPNRKYIYKVENTLDKDNYSINHINLNPSSITTNNGVIFNNLIKELSYIFERNDVFTEIEKNNKVYMIFNIWLKNRMQYYKRIYKTIQDVISDIGGISEFINILASYINSLYNSYVILFDFEKIISPSLKNKEKKNIMNNNIEIPNLNKNSMNSETNIELEKNSKSNNEFTSKEKVLRQETNLNNYAYIKEKGYKDESNVISGISDDKFNDLKNKQISFNKFFINKITCSKKNKYFDIYENFRTKIMSEEHLLKNHFDVYSLLKICEINGYEIEHTYVLKDLMNNG